MKVKVTVGVCVRNGATTIRESIESIIYQDYPHELMEVIFVDDGSEDETLSIIRSYVLKMDMYVKVFHQEWKGLGPSRNVVVNNASGEYIVWVDADMILPKDHVRKQVEFMEKNPKMGIGKARHGVLPGQNLVATLENIPSIVCDSRVEAPISKLPGTGGSIYRIDAVRQVGGFDNRLFSVGEDQDVAYRIMCANWLIKISDAYFFERREESWNTLWRKYLWYGYGNYFLYQKNKKIFRLYKMIPPSGFLAGISYSFSAYRITGLKVVFLVPLQFVFKSAAWCLGFFLGHLDSKKESKGRKLI